MASGDEEKNKQSRKLQKSYFDVLGICCSSEVPLIENILKSLDGVKECSVIVPSRTVIVVHDSLLISQLQIAKALNQARLEANVRLYGETNFKKKWPSPYAVVSGLLLALSFLKYVYAPLQWLAVGAVAAGIFPVIAKAFASIRRFRLDINTLAIIAVIATIALRDYTEAAAIVFLFTIAEWLESRAGHKASAVMLSLMSLAPQKAVIAETGEEVEVDEVKINTVVAVKAGETIPIDGVVVDGNCEVDEKTLTGEPFPVSKERDSTVWAGTINLNGYISVKTTALAEDCVVAKMAKLVEEAQNSKTKTQRFIDKCSQYYTPAIVVISAGFAVVPVAMRVHNLSHWFHLALVVLVSACPCGLILSTPVATFCALTKAATSGILIKGGDYLETLSKIKIAAFDKTGTITRGEFIVMDFRSLCQDISVHCLLYWVSSIESKSSHPMAAALVDYAKSASVEPRPDVVEDYQNFPGEGIYGKIDGRDVYIGNKRIAFRAGCSTVPDIKVDTRGGKTVGYIHVGERLAGIFNLSDACRSGVAQAIKELKSLGIKTAMLTGDNQAAALHAQEQLGDALEVVHAELLPEDKAKIIDELKKEGPTAMVGDGLNDAPALATADIGISMGISGSALATETGHVILMSNDIRKIPNAIKLARRAHRKVIENVVLSITIKGGILVLAFAGHPLIWAAVLADVGSCLLVILNSMLLLQEKYKTADKCYRASSSALSTQKLEGDDIEDLETGFLPKTSHGHCASGCCGKNLQEKTVKPADSVERLQRKNEHSFSCCCDEKQEETLKLLRWSCCEKPADLGQGQRAENERHCNSGCCGDKNQQEEENIILQSSCEKATLLETGPQMKSSLDCSPGCCANKTEKAKENNAMKSCCEKPAGSEKVLCMKSNGGCESGCCGQKGQMENKTMKKTFMGIPAELEQRPQKKTGGNCKSGCCGSKEKAEEKKTGGNCKSGCCGNKEKAADEKALICEDNPSDLEKEPQTKKERNCKSGSCCSDKQSKETSSEKTSKSVVGFQIKDNPDCKSGCYGSKFEVKQSCHEKLAQPLEVGLGIKTRGGCKSACCGNTEQAVEEKETKKGGPAKPADRESSLQVIKDYKNCKSSCCGNEQEKAKAMNHGCCLNPADLVASSQVKNDRHYMSTCCEDYEHGREQSCCEAKSREDCGSNCKGAKRHHTGGGCCRSYAKECCRHRQMAASFGGLTEIIIE